MGRDAVRSAFMVLGVALGLWALFNVRGGIGAWWSLPLIQQHGGLLVGGAASPRCRP